MAAVGQAPLIARYGTVFAAHDITVAQTLMSRADLTTRDGFLNARNALTGLLDQGVLPIANENDVVATEELRFGDNDPLSALIAQLVDADLLILLTGTDGLYTGDPRRHPDAELIRDGHVMTDELLASAAGAAGVGGSGGVRSKVEAARSASFDGIEVVVAGGNEPDVLPRIAAGERLGTRFAPRAGDPHQPRSLAQLRGHRARHPCVSTGAPKKPSPIPGGVCFPPASAPWMATSSGATWWRWPAPTTESSPGAS